MRRNDWEKIAMEEARKVLSEDDYLTIKEAIKKHKEIMFKYRPLARGGKWWYRSVKPLGYIYAEKSYLWGYHVLHGRDHSFRTEKISAVIMYPNIVEAIIDMTRYKFWWSGGMTGNSSTRTT